MDTFGRQSPPLPPDTVKVAPSEASFASLTSLTATPSPPSLTVVEEGVGREEMNRSAGNNKAAEKCVDPAVVVIKAVYCSVKSRNTLEMLSAPVTGLPSLAVVFLASQCLMLIRVAVLSLLGLIDCLHPRIDTNDESWNEFPGQKFPPEWELKGLSFAQQSGPVFPDRGSGRSQTTTSSFTQRPDSGVYLTPRHNMSSQISIASATTAPSLVYDYHRVGEMHFLNYKYSIFRIDPVMQRSMTTIHVFLTDIDKGRLLPMEASDVKNVLDVGTGTGDWALDVSDANPNIAIIGTDLAAIQPSSIRSNVTFYVDDANYPFWGWDNSINFIHMRGLNGGIKRWAVTLRAAFHCLHAGGWIEVSDMEFHPAGPLAPDSIWVDWYRMREVLTDRAELDVGIHKNGRGQHELEELGYQLPVQSRREYLVGYETHVYNDHSLLVCVVEQMKGTLARAMECMPLSVSLDNLMRRLETEIFNQGLIIEVNRIIAQKPSERSW